MQMLTFCPSVQTPYTPRAVKLIVSSLVHDNVTVRRTAQRLTHYVLKQRKRPIKKIAVDPYEVAGETKPENYVPGKLFYFKLTRVLLSLTLSRQQTVSSLL
jgi:hypothetical protein